MAISYLYVGVFYKEICKKVVPKDGVGRVHLQIVSSLCICDTKCKQ